jgi:hypothetical protein
MGFNFSDYTQEKYRNNLLQKTFNAIRNKAITGLVSFCFCLLKGKNILDLFRIKNFKRKKKIEYPLYSSPMYDTA